MSSLSHAIGGIFQPILKFVADILAFFYEIIPNYPIDVALLTIVIMALLTPLTVKSTKNMAAMQALGPEMKKLQQKYKGPENRAQLNEEMMKLYKEHNVNPASGCLPMLLQMPAFFILYSVIRGITNTVTIPAHTTDVGGLKVFHATQIIAVPRYISHTTKMYHDIVAAHGQLISFGIDFAQKLLSHHSSLWVAIPYLVLVLGSVGLQYLQMARLNARNPQAAQANPQAAMLQKYMPLIFGLIYLNVAAILNVYFIVSSAIRIGTQEVLFRKGMVAGPGTPPATASSGKPKTLSGPKAVEDVERALPKPKASNDPGQAAGATRARGKPPKDGNPTANGRNAPTGSNGSSGSNGKKAGTEPKKPAAGSGSATNGNGNSGSATGSDRTGPTKGHPRSKAKRDRKAR